MKNILLVFLSFQTLLISAQTNKYWQGNESWSILQASQYGGPEVDYISMKYYAINGDTIISGKTYKKTVLKSKSGSPTIFNGSPVLGSLTEPVYLLREENDTITVIDLAFNDTITIFYDWDAGHVFQKISSDTYPSYIPINTVTDSFNLNGIVRRYIETDYGYTYEGAISGQNLYAITNAYQLDGSNILTCYSSNDSTYVTLQGGEMLVNIFGSPHLNNAIILDTAIQGNCTLNGIYTSFGLENINESSIVVFPSFASDIITVKGLSQTYFHIYNSSGRIIQQGFLTSENTELNISAYLPGIYFIRLMQDGASKTVKFVKK